MKVQETTKRKLSKIGNYKLTGKILGKGNFARVEEAYHELLGIKVAIKIMDLNNIKEEYVIRNLFREARIMSKLNHPCIVSLFETMQKSDEVYYLITEAVIGGDLCTYVKAQRNRRLDEKIAKYFAQQFASAISYMHQKGIVHRDLKMENVMLNSSQTQIKIVDFGLSNEWSPDAPLKTHCGSPEYAAPELFVVSKVYGPEVDLWSLGIIFYGMVVGQLPFVSIESSNISSEERRKLLVAQINKGISVPQRKAISCFSVEFRNLMNRLLNADSKKRMNIKEMIVHPWITENGKKLIKTKPLKKVSTVFYNKAILDISSMCGIYSYEVPKIIERNPFGAVGAIMNILIHKNVVTSFTPDLLMRCVSDTSNSRVTKNMVRQKTESPLRLFQTARFQEDKSIEKMRRPHTTSTCNLGKAKSILTPQLTPNYSNMERGETSLTKSARPHSVQFSNNTKVKEFKGPISSAFHKRQEYSAIVASRYLQSNSKSIKSKKTLNCGDVNPNNILEYARKSETPTTTRADRVSDSNVPKKIPKTSPKPRSSTERSENVKSSSATEAQKNPYSRNMPHLFALMKLLAPHMDVEKKEGIEPRTKSGVRTGSNKSSNRHSGIPILPRATPARTKLRSSQPSSMNIETTVSNARRTK